MGVKHLLSEGFPRLQLGEAHNAQEVLKELSDCLWDLLILDIFMEGRSGLEILEDIKRQHPKLPVLILTMHREDETAIRALKGGASGYLTKESVATELLAAVKKLLSGGRYISNALAERMASKLADPRLLEGRPDLSEREYEVLRRLAQGKRVSEIANDLSISIKTVSTYRSRLLEKLGKRTTADLIRYAIEEKLFE